MKPETYTLQNFNQEMETGIQNQDLKFGRMLNFALEDKLSIVAECRQDPGDLYRLDENLNAVPMQDFSEFYYGLSPLIDSSMIIKNISKFSFSTENTLDSFISRNCRLFMCHKQQKDFLADFARYAVLALASNYAVCLKSAGIPRDLYRDLDSTGKILDLSDPDLIKIRGCPTRQILNALGALHFQSCEGRFWKFVPNAGITLQQIYSDPKNIRLINGQVFYSGVLLKPVRLEKMENNYENMAVESLKIIFERSTYATVFVLDGYYTEHPLLNEKSRQQMTALLQKDDAYKIAFIRALSTNGSAHINELKYMQENIDAVNQYLACCFNVNQIGVSANVVTSDQILLFGKRNSRTIDSGNLYPGVNGNTEVADPNVSFYRNSVYEDYPTIRLDSDRIDFAGEINREAYAELRIDAPKQEWICCGIMISGNMPEEENGIKESTAYVRHRRLHFNIIFEQQNPCTFEEITQSSAGAAEAFENAQIMGVKISLYRSRTDRLKQQILYICRFFLDLQDLIESLLLLALALFGTHTDGQGAMGVGEWVSLAFAVLIILYAGHAAWAQVTKFQRQHKSIRHLKICCWKSHETAVQKLNGLMDGYRFHPAAFACLALYTEKLLYDSACEASDRQ